MTHTTPPTRTTSAMPSRVTSRLRRLGHRVRINGLGHRRLAEPDARQLTAALLRDIDETILPRQMTVTTNAGQVFSLHVAGGRILELTLPGSNGQFKNDDDDPDLARKHLADTLGKCLSDATELTLHNDRTDGTHDLSALGCAANALAAELGLDLDALEDECLRDKALRRLGQHAQGLLILDSDGVLQHKHGAEPVTNRLEDLVAAHLNTLAFSLARMLEDGQTSGCACFGTDAETGLHLVYALCEDAPVIALLDGKRMHAMLPALQDLFAQYS